MRAYASRFIKPNDRLTSFERLEIYNRQYWFRVLSGMAEDFPGLRAVLGEKRFDAMCQGVLDGLPFAIVHAAQSRVDGWNPGCASIRIGPGRSKTLALDIVRLEWADIEAFDGKGRAGAAPRRSRQRVAGASLRLRLQPYIRLLDLRYPVDDLLLEVRKEDEDTDFASNAFRSAASASACTPWRNSSLRRSFWPCIASIIPFISGGSAAEEFAILTALREGKTLGRAIELRSRKAS